MRTSSVLLTREKLEALVELTYCEITLLGLQDSGSRDVHLYEI